MAIFTRKEAPPIYQDFRKYTPHLRQDFIFQCAYCERTESYLGGQEAFEADHFRPAHRFPELLCIYENLYYVCGKCNRHKSGTWPSDRQISQGSTFADPCAEDPYVDHLRETDQGDLEGLTSCGTYSNAHIRLSRAELRRWRLARRQARLDAPLLRSLEKTFGSSSFNVPSRIGTARDPDQAEAALARRIEDIQNPLLARLNIAGCTMFLSLLFFLLLTALHAQDLDIPQHGTTFHYGADANKPYLSPLRSPSGKIMTRGFPMENIPGESHDHLHHRGLWFSYDDVNGVKFWENDPSYVGVKPNVGKIVVQQAALVKDTLTAKMEWRDPSWQGPSLVEDRSMRFSSNPQTRTIDFNITLNAAVDVTFGRYRQRRRLRHPPLRCLHRQERRKNSGCRWTHHHGERLG